MEELYMVILANQLLADFVQRWWSYSKLKLVTPGEVIRAKDLLTVDIDNSGSSGGIV